MNDMTEFPADKTTEDVAGTVARGLQALENQDYAHLASQIKAIIVDQETFSSGQELFGQTYQALLALTQPEQSNPLLEALLEVPNAIPFMTLYPENFAEAQIALNWINILLQRTPADVDGLNARAQLFHYLGDAAATQEEAAPFYQRALQDSQNLASLEPDNALFFYLKGEANRKLGHDEQAIADYTQSIALNPAYPEALAARADVQVRQSAYDLAINDLHSAIQASPDYPYAHARLADLHFFLADQAQDATQLQEHSRAAVGEYNELIRLTPDMALAFYNRARSWARLGETFKALADFAQAIHLEPDNQEFIAARGYFYLDQNELELAENDFRRALAFDEKNINALGSLADTYQAMGDRQPTLELARPFYEWAIQGYQAVLDVEPAHRLALLRLAGAHRRLGETERTIELYNQVLEADPQDIDALNQRGLVYLDSSESAKALEDFTALVQLAPDDPVSLQGKS